MKTVMYNTGNSAETGRTMRAEEGKKNRALLEMKRSITLFA